MKHTKGKMEEFGGINCGQLPVSIGGRHFAIIKFTHLIDMKQDGANAAELVRRWNAFEEDGLVFDLLAACEAQKKADNWFGASSTGRKLKDKAKELRVDAIAKAKKGT